MPSTTYIKIMKIQNNNLKAALCKRSDYSYSIIKKFNKYLNTTSCQDQIMPTKNIISQSTRYYRSRINYLLRWCKYNIAPKN